MSYILDALRKSDQQRQRGAAPTLLTLQPSAVVRKRPAMLGYGLLAALLVGAGMVIGWLRPWQQEQAVPGRPESVAATAPESNPRHPAPAATDMASQPNADLKPELPARVKAPTEDPPSEVDGAAAPEQRVAAANTAGLKKVVSMEDLPLSIRQELPSMIISVHAYSADPARRLIGIGVRMLREGDYVMPGLKLEEIKADGIIFSYKGYRFRRGVK